jgi:hypothetical protein
VLEFAGDLGEQGCCLITAVGDQAFDHLWAVCRRDQTSVDGSTPRRSGSVRQEIGSRVYRG